MQRQFEPISGEILGAAVEVHRALGPGFLENVYENALVIALERRNIQLERQRPVQIWFGDQPVGTHRLDLLVANQIVVEIKAVKAFEGTLRPVRAYLKATRLHVGLLLNFNAPLLVAKRVVL